jgi:hypothetical protein
MFVNKRTGDVGVNNLHRVNLSDFAQIIDHEKIGDRKIDNGVTSDRKIGDRKIDNGVTSDRKIGDRKIGDSMNHLTLANIQ